MIRNPIQLGSAKSRIEKLKKEINDLIRQFKGNELQAYVVPVANEIRELERQILRYEKITSGSLVDSVRYLQDCPTPIANIGELMTSLRIANKLTQEQMAAKLGWQQPNLSRFESENYSAQTIKNVVEYAGALGISLKVVPQVPITLHAGTSFYRSFRETVLGKVETLDTTIKTDGSLISPVENTTGELDVKVIEISNIEAE